MTLSVTPCTDPSAWDEYVNRFNGHPQQLWGWGKTKADHGWRADRLLISDGGEVVGSAQLLIRPLPFPFRALAYIPRGPQGEPGREIQLLDAVAAYAKEAHRAVALTIEPDWGTAAGTTVQLPGAGFRHSTNTILIPRTLILDLALSEDDLLAGMSKKHRQYIRKSGREDLEYRAVTREEIPQCLAVYQQTAERAGFGIHEDRYYQDIFENLGAGSPVYAAFKGSDVVAFLWLSASGHTAFELYGGMTEEGERLRANYALKWLAIREMKERGIIRYDFNGLLNDGVSRFKMGWAQHEDLLAGTWDKPLSPLYPVFTTALPLAKTTLRKARGALAGLRGRLRGRR
ncbi:peptidoglycan bridge formation glycyltransferase FemA/FemB family protein [Arthrobacter sp. Sa2BUA2]|uniref:Peptidoglycan bridge formation glycyltransferase FemA/FemB family protein n=1 Tax=Arthrobacter pullicola TaxID=2762224 RepID=A0ABR8YG67_9MICC|nr:peptidoglycan bridge formation glycyltransferase FemA/FemB family protein [Arthrobacter pullicola]MBD8043133.1 peptidoglycan bridge formation glycyltransferase FemA/FemB family protein [Arthrobacter pullicola]